MVCVKRCHTNHPFTQTIFFAVLHIIWFVWTGTIPLHNPSLHTKDLSFPVLHFFGFVWRDVIQRMIKGLCDYVVSVDVIQRMINGLCDGIYLVCVIIWFVWINGLCEWMVCVKGCNTANDKWFVWLSGMYYILSGLCDYLVCVNKWFVWLSGLCGWFVWRDVIQRMINGLCEGIHLVCVNIWSVRMNGLFVWLSGLCE